MEMGLEMDYGVIDGAGGHMEYLRDGVSLELNVRDMPSEKVVEKSVPLHPPPLQGSDVLALLMITFGKG